MRGTYGGWRGRPPEVWTLSLMLALGTAMCLLSALRPLTPAAPVRLNLVVAGLALVTAAALWRAGRRVRPAGLHASLLLCVAAASSLVASAATGEGALGGSFAFMWMAVYAALFFSRRAARSYAALLAASLAAALAINRPLGGAMTWLIVASSSALAVEMLAVLIDRLRTASSTDALTGLPNRWGLEQHAARLGRPAGGALTVAVVDLDGFKDINDHRGHAAGDEVLAELAAAWSAALRPGDVIARLGGDEFVLLLSCGAQQAHAVLERLPSHPAIGWSLGVAELRAGEDLHQAMARADAQMYTAKAARRRRGVCAPGGRQRAGATKA